MIARKKLDLYFDYTPSIYREGEFFTYDPRSTKGINVHSCREAFETCINENTQWIGFVCRDLDAKKLNQFFTKIEKQLRLKQNSLFYKTNTDDNFVLIKASPFWLENNLTRGFFTLFIRAGGAYYKGNFEEAINEYGLARNIKTAIYWFLEGNTKVEGKMINEGSLVETLEDYNRRQLMTYLVNPKKKNRVKVNNYSLYMASMNILKN